MYHYNHFHLCHKNRDISLYAIAEARFILPTMGFQLSYSGDRRGRTSEKEKGKVGGEGNKKRKEAGEKERANTTITTIYYSSATFSFPIAAPAPVDRASWLLFSPSTGPDAMGGFPASPTFLAMYPVPIFFSFFFFFVLSSVG